jgi:hypothetical protein
MTDQELRDYAADHIYYRLEMLLGDQKKGWSVENIFRLFLWSPSPLLRTRGSGATRYKRCCIHQGFAEGSSNTYKNLDRHVVVRWAHSLVTYHRGG